MANSRLILFALIGMAISAPAPAADNIAWGDAQDGIRIGIATPSAFPAPAVRVIFGNVGPAERTLLIGRTTGRGPVYSLSFTATAPDGQETKFLNGGQAGVAGYMGPVAIQLAPGGIDEIAIPMSKLFTIAPPGQGTSLDQLLRLHYSLRVSLAVDQSEVEWARKSNVTASNGQKFWTGAMDSGEFSEPQ